MGLYVPVRPRSLDSFCIVIYYAMKWAKTFLTYSLVICVIRRTATVNYALKISHAVLILRFYIL